MIIKLPPPKKTGFPEARRHDNMSKCYVLKILLTFLIAQIFNLLIPADGNSVPLDSDQFASISDFSDSTGSSTGINLPDILPNGFETGKDTRVQETSQFNKVFFNGPEINSPDAFAVDVMTICEGEYATISASTVQNAMAMEWSTTGDGAFSDIHDISTVYYPGPEDITLGEVRLLLTAFPEGGCTEISLYRISVVISRIPEANLMDEKNLEYNDYDLVNGDWLPVSTENNITGDFESIAWTTNGDGTFDNPNAESPNYYPGIHDKWNGEIELCVNVQSEAVCQVNLTQCMTLHIPQQLVAFYQDGWAGLSSFLNPDLQTVPEVVYPLVQIPGSKHLVSMIDENGAYYWPEMIPPQSTLTDWEQTGYKVNLKNTGAYLSIYGDSLADQTFTVAGSFNYLPVLTNVPVSIESLFYGHTEDIITIFDWKNDHVWTPGAADFDTIYPGNAYLLFNVADVESYFIAFPDFVADAPFYFQKPGTKNSRIKHSPWPEISHTAIPHIILFSNQAKAKLRQGDIIGVFNRNGNCFGVAEFVPNTETFKLVAMGANGFDESRGFAANEKMYFRNYNVFTGEETQISLNFDTTTTPSSGNFQNNSVSIVADFTKSTQAITSCRTDQAIAETKVFPNPVADILHIHSKGEMCEIQISNITGQQVINKSIEGFSATVPVSNLDQGVYFLMIKFRDQSRIKKKIAIR